MDDPSKGATMKSGGGEAGKNKPSGNQEKFGTQKEDMMGKLKKQTGGVSPFDTRDAIAIPLKYANPTSSPLKFQVKKGTNHSDVELTDGARTSWQAGYSTNGAGGAFERTPCRRLSYL